MKPFGLPLFPDRLVRLEWLFGLGVAAGAGMARQLPEQWAAWLYFGLAVSVSAGLAAACFRWPAAVAFVLSVAGGALAVPLSRMLPADHYSRLLDGSPRSGQMLLRVIDTGVPEAAELPLPGLIAAEAREMRLSGEPDFVKVSGRIFFRLPREALHRPRYGDILLLDGGFRSPERETVYLTEDGRLQPPPAGGSDFSSYLRARRVAAILSAREMTYLDFQPGIMGRILRGRDFFLERAWSRVDDPRHRQAIAGIFFGCRGGLDAATRRDLIRSGTIHIFSVSGLHVGILAAVLFWLLRALPFRIRHLAVPALILLYVLTTGAEVPALRAFWMIAVWCLLRVFLLNTPALNLLLLLGGIMILLNPDNLGDIGFLYSFVITAVLLLLAGNWRPVRPYFLDPAPMMPDSDLRRRVLWFGKSKLRFLAAAVSCLAAFLGGSAISLVFQGLFLPGSILANLWTMPLIALLFQAMAAKLLLGWIGGLDQLFAWLIGLLFRLMDGIISLVAAIFDSTAGRVPTAVELIVFYLALTLALLASVRARIRIAAAATLIVILVFWHLPPEAERSSVLLIYGGRTVEPAVGIVDRRAGTGTVINVPDAAAATELARYFKRHGVSRVDRVLFTLARAGAANGLGALLREMPVGVVELPPADPYRRSFLARLAEQEEAYPDLCFAEPGRGPVGILRENGVLRIDYSNPGSKLTGTLRFYEDAAAPYCEIAAGEKVFRRELPAGNLAEITEYAF